jgi:hypothetical protein
VEWAYINLGPWEGPWWWVLRREAAAVVMVVVVVVVVVVRWSWMFIIFEGWVSASIVAVAADHTFQPGCGLLASCHLGMGTH